MTGLKGRDLISLADLTPAEFHAILDLAVGLKGSMRHGERPALCAGKTLAMIFQKPSTRTRVSFDTAMFQLGGHSIYLSAYDIQLGHGETVPDTARVLSKMVDGIMIRTFAQEDVIDLAHFASIPVINGLTDLEHPCQILADLLTVREYKGRLEGLELAWVGDGNNVCHSMIQGAALAGMKMRVASPPGYEPNAEIVARARAAGEAQGFTLTIGHDPVEAVTGADIIATDAWTSMGQEKEQELRAEVFPPYQVNAALIRHARPDFLFLHCLPAHRNEEVTDEVIDGPHSVVWDEAGNRLHAQKALLALLL